MILPVDILPSIMCEYAREILYGIYRSNITRIYSRHAFNATLGWTAKTQVTFKFKLVDSLFNGSTPSLAITLVNISSSTFEGMGRYRCLSRSVYFHPEHPMKYSFPYFERPFEGNKLIIGSEIAEPRRTEASFLIMGFPVHGTLHLSFCASE